MASSDIENFASEFQSSEQITPSSACATRDVKPSVTRQERPPLEVSNSSNYFHDSHQVHNPATARWTKLHKGGDSEENIPDSQHDLSSQASKETSEEHYHTSGVERPWDCEVKGDDSGRQRRLDKQDEMGGETYRDQYGSREVKGCNFFEEIIDVDLEAGFGEDEDFGGKEDQVKSGLRDSREGSHTDDEELSNYEHYTQSRCSEDEDSRMDSTKLELRYDDHCMDMATDADTEVEAPYQDNGDNTSVHQNATERTWLSFSSSKQEESMGHSHKDFWEAEKLKVQLEEDLGMWKKKGRRMKHNMRGAHTSSDLTMEKNPEHIEHVMRDMLAELRVDEQRVSTDVNDEVGGKHLWPRLALSESNGNSYKLMVMAFEELLKEFEETANKNKKKLDDVLRAKEEEAEFMQQQRRAWFEKENQLRSRISSLELQKGRLSDMLRETAAALMAEKERRKDSRCEVERVMDMLSKEKKAHHETVEKLNTYINSFIKLRGNLSAQKSGSAKEGGTLRLEIVESVLRDIDRELHLSFNHSAQSSTKASESDVGTSKVDELNRVKQQLHAAEAERDLVEGRLSTLLRETREGHGEMEALWLEREKLLEQKVGCLEVELQYLHTKSRRKEAEVMIERQRWADELEKCMQAWARERNAWEVSMKERGWLKAALNDEAHLESRDEYIVDGGNLDLGRKEDVDIECEDKTMKEARWEKETEQWRDLAEQYKQERNEIENKLSTALILVKKLEQNIKAKEVEMEEERKQLEGVISTKSAEVEKLKQSLKSKERDLEVTIQKFTDEVKLIDKEVERERKEREQVMELHFASKRQLVCDIKAKEECWEKTLEARSQELQMLEDQVTNKQKEVEELLKRTEEEKMMRETIAQELQREKTVIRKEMEEMLADIWKLCEDEGIQAAVAEKLLPGADLGLSRPMWEALWLEYCRSREISGDAKVTPSTLEWEFARGKVSRFEKQITDAMSAIKHLRDEVKAKEEQLMKVKADREKEWEQRERDWAREKDTLIHLVDSLQQKEVQLAGERQSRGQEFEKKMEALEELRRIEQEEAAEIISSLQGSSRELEWCLKRTNSLPSRRVNIAKRGSIPRGGLTPSPDKSNELVKVHASYLEEVDRYIFELESKKEAADRSLRNSQTAFEGECFESPKEDRDVNNGLMQFENGLHASSDAEADFNPLLCIDDDGRLSPRVSREWSGLGGSAARGARQSTARPLERGMCLTLNGLHTLTQESPWTEAADGNLPIWQPDNHKRLASSGSFNGSSNTWMSDEMQLYPGSPTRGCLTLPAPSTPTKRPQKWLVDVRWLEQVRKEHASLRQQLDIERQRVSALGRVEADNRWIEAAIIRALELKRQSDTKAAEMQRKLAAMETLYSPRNRVDSRS